MNFLHFLFGILILGTFTADASIGETYKQLCRRFGWPAETHLANKDTEIWMETHRKPEPKEAPVDEASPINGLQQL